MKKIIILVIITILFFVHDVNGQVKKFGKVSKEELESKVDKEFGGANAVVLFKKRRSHYNYDEDNGFSLITEVHERIKLYNKEAFDYATKKLRYYIAGAKDEKISIKATTYNLEDGKVVKTKLKKKNIFDKKENKFWSSKSFTMPNLKEGCIVEWKYTIESPYKKINDIVFQYNIPIKHIDAKINIPEYFMYNANASKYYMVNIKKSRSSNYINRIKDSYGKETKYDRLEIVENVYKINLTNVKALKEEPYVNNINNYRGKVEFELTGIKYPNSSYKSYSTDWNSVTKTIYQSSSFGGELKKTNYFKKDLAEIIKDTKSKDEKIMAIFSFVKKKIKWNNYYDYYTHTGVRKAYKDGVGNVAEINLILVAMLREAGIDTSPVLVSTRSHGVPIFPTRDGFNYVIAGVELLNELILLDATEPYSLPNVLPKRVLNWRGRIIRKHGSSAFIDLLPKVYSVDVKRLNVKMDENGTINGSMNIIYKNLDALTSRNVFNSLNEESVIKRIESSYKPIEIEKIRLNNKNNLGKPFAITVKYSADNQVEKINEKLYFSPLFFLGAKKNVFKLEERNYPIDYGAAWMANKEVIIQVPEGYKVEKTPEDITIETENNVANFSYKTMLKGDKIVVKVSTKINFPVIPFNFYKELKDFYTKRILKEKEKIVLVKE